MSYYADSIPRSRRDSISRELLCGFYPPYKNAILALKSTSLRVPSHHAARYEHITRQTQPPETDTVWRRPDKRPGQRPGTSDDVFWRRLGASGVLNTITSAVQLAKQANDNKVKVLLQTGSTANTLFILNPDGTKGQSVSYPIPDRQK